MTHPLWPLFDLQLRTEHLELRLPSDDEIVALCAVENGLGRIAPLGVARATRRFAMTRARWTSRPHRAVAIDGLAGCLDLFRIAGSTG